MTTLRQIRSLLTPFLERHAELSLRGQYLFMRPLRHVVRVVHLDRTGEAKRFRPRWAAINLCEPLDSMPFNWATMIYPERTSLWEWDDPMLQADFFQILEEQTLPQMREVETLDGFVGYASMEDKFLVGGFDEFLLRTIGVDIARGRFDAARAACEKLASGMTKWSDPVWREEFVRITGTLCPLLAANDRPGMARLLHEWEAYTVEKLGIGDLWEKTPFPMELLPAADG